MMNKHYSPNLKGFAEKLNLKNGIYDLIKRPIPKQDVLYFEQNDINGNNQNRNANRYSGRKYKRGGVKRR